jgi:hypothetical protein
VTGPEHYAEGEKFLRHAEHQESHEAATADAAIALAHFAAVQALRPSTNWRDNDDHDLS